MSSFAVNSPKAPKNMVNMRDGIMPGENKDL